MKFCYIKKNIFNTNDLSDWLGSVADGLGNGDPSKVNAWRVAGSQLAGLAGAAAVDGNVNEGAWIAKQADTYNRQLHKEELKLIKDSYKEYAEEHGLSEGEALKELTEQAMAMGDEEGNKELFIDPESGKRAEAWLNQLGAGNAIQGGDGQATGQQYFAATDEQYQNQLLNLGQVTASDAAYNPFQHADGNINNVMQAAAHDGSRLNSAEAAYDLVNLQYGGNYQAFVDDAKALVPTLIGQFQTAKQNLQAIKDANPDMSFDDLMNTQEYRDLKHLQQGLLYSANLLNNPALPQDDLELDDIRRGVNLYNSTIALGLGNGANRPPKLGLLKGLEPPLKVVRNPVRGVDRGDVKNTGPRVTIRDHYDHHNEMRTDVIDQLKGQGYRVADGEASFGSSCGAGRCRPDIIYEAPDGTKGIIEIKTGNADLSIRQTEIFPQIKDGSAIPRGKVAARFGLRPGVPLKDQGYPNGIPIEIREFPGAG